MNDKNKWWIVPGSVCELRNTESLGLTDRFRSGGEIKTRFDLVTGQELPYPVEHIAEVYRTHYGIDVPYVFDAIKSITDVATRSFIVYARPELTVRKHIHPPVVDISGKYVRDRRTISFGIPSKIIQPSTDRLFFYESKFDFSEYDETKMSPEEKLSLHDSIINSATVPTRIIPFPNQDQCLVLDFDSTNTVHWADHHTANEYFFIAYEL